MTKIVLTFLLIPMLSLAQHTNQDSLLTIIKNIRQTKVDTSHVRQLSHLGYDLIETDSLLSKELLDEALTKSLKVKELNTIANCYRLLGLWYDSFGKQDLSLKNYRLSLEAAKKTNNLYLMAGAWFNMGNIKYSRAEYDSCIYFYQHAQKVFEDPKILDNPQAKPNIIDKRKADLYGNLSSIFSTVGNLKKADEYIDKAIEISQKYKSPAAALGTAYFMQSKADNYYDNGYVGKALDIRLEYLPYMESKQNLKANLSDSYNSIAREYAELEQLDSAKIYAEKSLKIALDIKQPDAIANAYFELASIAIETNNFQQATLHISNIKEYYETSENPVQKGRYYKLMEQWSYAQGNYKAAYKYFGRYQNIRDSILEGKRAKAFQEMEMRFETEKKDSKIKLQEEQINRKNLLNWLLFGGLVSLLLIGFLVYRNYNHRKKIQQQRITELETEKQLLATQSLLKGQEEERSRIAKDLHDGLGGLLSGVKLQLGAMRGNLILTEEHGVVFNRALDKLDESISEMRRVAHNMMPETLLKFGLPQALLDYGNGLSQGQDFEISCEFHGLEKRLDNSTEIVVYRIVQELINNAVKHSEATKILVQVMRHDNKNLNITVEDNGKGFNPDAVGQNSAGLRNIASRVKYLNGKMDIQSGAGNGTSVYIECELPQNG